MREVVKKYKWNKGALCFWQQGSLADVGATTTQDGGKEKVGSDGVRVAGVQWAPYRAYLRELDMDVFRILQAGLLTHNALDTELNVKVSAHFHVYLIICVFW